MSIQYSADRMDSAIMKQLSGAFKIQLLRISEELVKYNKKITIPGSFTFNNLSFVDTEKLTVEYGEIKDIYRLSPMQLGFYYHALSEPKSHAYFVQICYKISGNISVEKLKYSFSEIIYRHELLRTVFRDDIAEVPLQLVQKNVAPDFRYYDISKNKNSEQEDI